MTTWTLANGRLENSSAVYDVRRDGETVQAGVGYRQARKYIYANAAPDDWYVEGGNESYAGNSIAVLQQMDADLDAAINGEISHEEWQRRGAANQGK